MRTVHVPLFGFVADRWNELCGYVTREPYTEGLGFVLFKATDSNNVPLIMALTLLSFVVTSNANAALLALDHRLHRRTTPARS
jgi:hypothetical protein